MRRPDPSRRFPPAEPTPLRLLALGGLLLLTLDAATAGPRAPALAAGRRLTERLAGGESRRHPVELAAGQFLRALVTEQGIDVEVRLLAPGGAAVARVDGATPPQEDEELAAIAPRGGTYQLEVRSTEPRKPPGRFVLRITDLRPAADRDRRRAEAIALTQEADDQMIRQDETGWRLQLATRERSLALWRALGDRRRTAMALFRSGQLRFDLRQYAPAAECLHRAVDAFRAAGDRSGLAEALNEAGRADRKLGRPAEAVGHFKAALPLARAGTGDTLQANLLDNLGNAYADLGRPREELDSLVKARDLARRVGNPAVEARILINLGSAYADLGERQKALAGYHEALEIAQRGDLRALQAAAWNNLGDTHEVLGQWDEALTEHRRAHALFHTLGELQTLGDRAAEARSLNQLALIEYHLARYAEAAKDLSGAVAIGRDFGDPTVEATARAILAFVDLERGQPARARADAEAARQAAPAHGEAEVSAWIALGVVRRAGGDRPGATAALAHARELARARGDGTSEANATLQLAETARQGGDLTRAAELAGGAIDIVESLRTRVASHDLRASFLTSIQSFYELAIDTSMALERARPGQGYAARALTLAERARARSLLEILAAAGAAPRRHVAAELAARERRARDAVSAAELERVELLRREPPPGAPAAAAAGSRFEAALATYEQIEREVADKSPSYASLIEPQPLSAGEIERRVLDPDTLLLELALGERRSFLWVVSDRALTSYELPRAGGRRGRRPPLLRPGDGAERLPAGRDPRRPPGAARARRARASRRGGDPLPHAPRAGRGAPRPSPAGGGRRRPAAVRAVPRAAGPGGSGQAPRRRP